MNLSNGRIWPYAIGLSILLIFGACVTTIVVTSTMPVQKADTYMMDYHDADANANELIEARISFDKKYSIEYIANPLATQNATIQYKITDTNENHINDARMKVVFTRPNELGHNVELGMPRVSEGVYTFSGINLPLEGRWDIMAKVEIGEESRYYNLKADTRETTVKEY